MTSISALAKAVPKTAKSAGVLYFRAVVLSLRPVLATLVFAPPEVAEEIDRIHRAITESKTWGEFRRRMPPQEYAALCAESFSTDAEVIAENPEAAPPADDAEFSALDVPSFCDGDYPRWIATEQDRYIPADILREFGTRVDTALNGSIWRIYADRREEVLAALRSHGYQLIQREDLQIA